jgi:hypothetical protein
MTDATRKTQPYRAVHGRGSTAALAAMLKGRTAHGHNPQDVKRTLTRTVNHKHLSGLLGKKR